MDKTITINRKARYEYHIEDRYEAGIVLTGTEVKSLRLGNANLADSYASIRDGEIWLLNAHIAKYREGTIYNHEPRRKRKLLLHKSEIRRLRTKINERGFTLVPLKLYFSKSHVKVELALARGKKLYDKREAIAKKEAKRAMERSMGHGG